MYYKSGYWNDYPAVAAEINRRLTGDRNCGYATEFHRHCGGRRFARALFLNCGNGWVEREFLQAGIIESAVGIDISSDLLDQARAAAVGLPLSYVESDINSESLPDEGYDLIVNFAAAHHIRYLDRVFRGLARSITADGYFLSYDYIGPHRNQYPYQQWEAVWNLNRSLAPHVRQRLAYPHLPTMLATDVSEAIHSELIESIYARYFSVERFRRAGGALAYPLLTFNEALQALPPAEADEVIAQIIAADATYLADHPDSTLFACWYGRRKAAPLADHALLDRWTADEIEREARVDDSGGLYYPQTLLAALMYDPGDTGAER